MPDDKTPRADASAAPAATGGSGDYRYIQARRTLVYIEQSIKQTLQQYVFAPNDAGTWNAVIAAVSSFLTTLWQQGELKGASANDAYSVACGLGTTMTAQDILDGNLNMVVQVALVDPGEFTTLTLQQMMAKS